MVLVAYAGPVRPAAALRDSVLCLPTDIHSLFVNKPSSSSCCCCCCSSSSSFCVLLGLKPVSPQPLSYFLLPSLSSIPTKTHAPRIPRHGHQTTSSSSIFHTPGARGRGGREFRSLSCSRATGKL